jgi:phosphoribosylformimino-5-aminoimidazole carboxamide ribotide isomerase
MDVIPAIDLLGAVRLYQDDYDQSQVFDEHPVGSAHPCMLRAR